VSSKETAQEAAEGGVPVKTKTKDRLTRYAILLILFVVLVSNDLFWPSYLSLGSRGNVSLFICIVLNFVIGMIQRKPKDDPNTEGNDGPED
jgi:hypothetical protein